MAFANFLGKNTLAAAQVLRGFDSTEYCRMLDAHVVALTWENTDRFETEVCVELAAELLARLFPKLFLNNGSDLANRIRQLTLSINPSVEFASDQTQVTCGIGIGNVPRLSDIWFYAGSDMWSALLSSKAAVTSGQSRIPFGAAAASCLAVANIFRHVFAQQLPGRQLDEEVQLSLLDFSTHQTALELPLGNIDVGELFLVGIGAVGVAASWCLARVKNLAGTLHLIDQERIALSNLQRYMGTTQEHVNTSSSKVAIAEAFFAGEAIRVQAHASTFGEFLYHRNNWHLETVAVAVDSAQVRCEIQASLPRILLNAWTGENGDVGLSRHNDFGTRACLGCLYMSAAPKKNLDELVAEAIKMPQALQMIRTLLATNEPLTQEHIRQIAAANSVNEADLGQFIGKGLLTFYQEAVCGGALLRFGADAPETEVPLAFQSALSGVLLAAEIVAHASGMHGDLPNTTRINLLTSFPDQLCFEIARRAQGPCLCSDLDFVQVYQDKYSFEAVRA